MERNKILVQSHYFAREMKIERERKREREREDSRDRGEDDKEGGRRPGKRVQGAGGGRERQIR